jgi:hypothetical protein
MNGSRHKARPVSVAMAVMLSIACIAPAASGAATAYATAQSPQYVSGYGSWARSYGSWDAYKSSSQTVRSRLASSYYRYMDADNHTVYVKFVSQAGIHAGAGNTNTGNAVGSSWTSFTSRPSFTLYPQETGSVKVTASIRLS